MKNIINTSGGLKGVDTNGNTGNATKCQFQIKALILTVIGNFEVQ